MFLSRILSVSFRQEQILSRIHADVEGFKADMQSYLNNHEDPGRSELDTLLGNLNGAEYEMKRLDGAGYEINQNAMEDAESTLTQWRKEAKTQVSNINFTLLK